jgi:hypothetical protein
MGVQGTLAVKPACEYRDILNQKRHSEVNEERKVIIQKLDNAVNNGLDRITIENLLPENNEYLISLGYDVKTELPCGNGSIGSFISIP